MGSLAEEDADDRRQVSRKKVKLQRIFAAEIAVEEAQAQSCFVHIHDLSEVGMRVHTDFDFPPDRDVSIKLFLEQPVSLKVRLAWHKELIGGMRVVGLAFRDTSDEQLGEIREFLERYSPDNKRCSLRLQRMLMVEMTLGSVRQKFGVFTLDISTSGIRISHDYPLPEELDIPFHILLEYDRPALAVTARVSWQEPNSLGQYIIGLQFCDPSPEAIARIEDFIETQLRGEPPAAAAVLPLADFEAP